MANKHAPPSLPETEKNKRSFPPPTLAVKSRDRHSHFLHLGLL